MNSSSNGPGRARWRELIDRHLLGTISGEQSRELEATLAASREARADFRRRCNVDSALRRQASAQTQSTPARGEKVWRVWLSPAQWAAAAAVVMSVGAIFFGIGKWSAASKRAEPSRRFVATLVAAKDCAWEGSAPVVGGRLPDTTLTLKRGLAAIVFDSGARLALDGGSALRLKDANAAELLRGRASVRCPESAFGFSLTTPNSTVVDLGTEFGAAVTAEGATEVHVFEGEVELAARADARATNRLPTELIVAGQAVRIASAKAQLIAMKRESFPRELAAAALELKPGKLLAMESFDYPEGPLGVSEGGFGWGGPWSGVNPGQASAVPVGAGTMANLAAGFPSPTGRVLLHSGTKEVKRRLSQPIDPAREQRIYASCYLKKSGHDADRSGKAMLMLRSSADPGAFIAVGVDWENRFFIANQGRNTVSDLRLVEGRAYFLVARYDFHRDLPDEVSLAVFDAESGQLSGEPVAWPVRGSHTGGAAAFDLLTLRNKRWGVIEFDEIRVGTSWDAVTGQATKK